MATLSPYFQKYTPYPFPSGTVPVNNVSDMISYNVIVPDSEVGIAYNVGASGSFQYDYIIKNITKNTKLRVEVVPHAYFSASVSAPIILTPAQQQTITISLDKAKLNLDAGVQDVSASVLIKVTNLPESQSLRDTTLSLVSSSRLPTSSVEVI